MTPHGSNSASSYPQNPEEWRRWIMTNLGIDSIKGRKMSENNNFPFSDLIYAWEREFTIEGGYSPSFIPALSRNKRGFVKWVFLDAPEPNWSKSDTDEIR
jgi:hypothetical protein